MKISIDMKYLAVIVTPPLRSSNEENVSPQRDAAIPTTANQRNVRHMDRQTDVQNLDCSLQQMYIDQQVVGKTTYFEV